MPGSEPVMEDHPELQKLLSLPNEDLSPVMKDHEFVRVIEDVIDTLIKTNVLRLTDLPEAAQQKLIRRKDLRDKLQGSLDLIGRDDRIL